MAFNTRLATIAATLALVPTIPAADGGTIRQPEIRIQDEIHVAVMEHGYPRVGGTSPVQLQAERGGPQGLFPNHGANIYLIPLAAVQVSANAKTPDDWIQQNLRRDHTNSQSSNCQTLTATRVALGTSLRFRQISAECQTKSPARS